VRPIALRDRLKRRPSCGDVEIALCIRQYNALVRAIGHFERSREGARHVAGRPGSAAARDQRSLNVHVTDGVP